MTNPLLFLHEATHAKLLATDFAVCAFSRREVESGLVGDAVDRLMQLSDDDAIAGHLEGRVALVFEGYDEDPRELYEIAEIVRFFRAVTDAWPLWFHFLERSGASLGVALRLLVDTQVVGRASGTCHADMDRDALQATLMRLFDGMNGLHARLGLPSAHTQRSSDRIIEAALG